MANSERKRSIMMSVRLLRGACRRTRSLAITGYLQQLLLESELPDNEPRPGLEADAVTDFRQLVGGLVDLEVDIGRELLQGERKEQAT